MVYCIKCGVELKDTEKKCPLCDTVVYHPDIKRAEAKPLYPKREEFSEPPMNRSGTLFILTTLCFVAIVVTLLCDFSITGNFTWSHYIWSAIVMLYIIVVLPIWFRKPNPVIFVSSDYGALMLYLWLINHLTDGSWFLTFALPVVVYNALVVNAVIVLTHYLRKGYLFIFGGAIILNGFFAIIMEFLINYTFKIREPLHFVWSIYPLVALFTTGMALIVIAICPPLKESLRKKFFL